MALFQFVRKLDASKGYSLSDIPVFSALTPAEQRLIEKKARLVEYKRGDIVYEEGKPAEAFYVVVAGRFRLFQKARPGKSEETLIYFYRGDHFGEASLLTGNMHSGYVEAKRDGLLLKLEKDDFLKLVHDIPAISRHLNRSLGHRLTKMEDTSNRREVKISALYSKSVTPAAFQFWLDFSATLTELTKRKIIFLDFVSGVHPLFQGEFQTASFSPYDLSRVESSSFEDFKTHLVKHPKGFHFLHVIVHEEKEKENKRVAGLLTFLTYRYDYLMLRLPREMNDISYKILKQSDTVYAHLGTHSDDLPQYAQIIAEWQQDFGFSKNDIRVIAAEDTESKISFEKKSELLGVPIFSYLPSKIEQPDRYHLTLKFISKELAGTLLGLALGSGAAYGLAHIGVLRVLEKEGVLPDIISGSSIGALIGGFWAAGFNADELERMAKSIDKKSGFFKLLGFRDLSVAHWGFFKGNQVTRFMESYLGDKTFQDLKIPCKIIGANLFTSEEVVFETGRVVDAIRASISIPGIFRPVHHQGKTLIDGGVVDPLPVRVLTEMGVKKIIAVNVLPGPKDRVEKNRLTEEIHKRQMEILSQKNIIKRTFAQLSDKVYHRYAVNIFNVIMSTIQFLEYEIAESWGAQADISIHPIVQEAHWAEFYSPDKFIKIGEEKTQEQIEEIKHLLVE